MADNIAGAAAWLGGTEIVNDSRTTAYMRNGIKPSTLVVNGDCGCPDVLVLAGCDNSYNTPAEDDAPWYDSAIPESAEFAGFLTTEFEGMGSTYSRSVIESITDGASLGRARFSSRTMTWKGFLFGSSCCGVAYGFRWLTSILRGSNRCGNSCSGEDLELLVCCPSIEAALGLGPTLICNGDFENNIGSWTEGLNTNLFWNNAVVYSDAGSMKVVNGVGGAMAFSNSSDCIMPVTQQRSYILSLQARADVNSTPETVGVVFNWFNNIDAPLGTTSVLNMGTTSPSGWTLMETTVLAPLNATRVSIDYSIGDGATLANQTQYVDTIAFTQVDYANKVEPFRTIKNVSLLEGPIISSERKMGATCGGRCGGSTAMEIEFSLVGSQPWLYSSPIPIVECVNVLDNSVPIIGSTLDGFLDATLLIAGTTATSDEFADLPVIPNGQSVYLVLNPQNSTAEVVLVTAHTTGSNTVTIIRAQQGTNAIEHADGSPWLLQPVCNDNNCTESVLATIADYTGELCVPPMLPPTSTYSGCFIPDTTSYRAIYITAPREMWNSISEVVPVITISNGNFPIVNARLSFYTSADGNPCGDLFNNPSECELLCDELFIKAIPNNAKFYIDGRTQKMSIVCGANNVFPGEPFTLGPFSWPVFSCYGFCMEFAYDPAPIDLTPSRDLCISMSLVPRTVV